MAGCRDLGQEAAATTRQIAEELARGPDAHPRQRAALAEHFVGVERGELPSVHELAGAAGRGAPSRC